MWFYILLLIILLFAIYCCGTKNYDYWKRKRVKYDTPLPFVGNEFSIYMQMTSMAEFYADLYRRYPEEKVVGFYRASEPCLIIRDPDMIKQILMTDFHYFHLRGISPFDIKYEPMFWNLFSAEGDVWRLLRQRLTPAFSSGRLKAMFPLIVERAERLQIYAEDLAHNGTTVDVRDLLARFSTDFIGACGFGIESDAINDENSNFRRIGKRMFQLTLRDSIVGAAKVTFPEIFKRIKYVVPEIEEGIQQILREVMKQRNYKPSGRHDFVDILLELKEKGAIVGESIEKRHDDGSPKVARLELNDEIMAAQIYIFFAAGFETTSSSASFTLHQLAFHPEEQKKVQEEIDNTLRKYGGKICYEAVKDLKYLEMAFNESLRLFPPVGFILRKSARPYTFQGTDMTIDAGVGVYISTQAMHNDEKYFEDADQFRPDRFHPDNKINEKCVFMPFGAGPRSCVGE